jgi:hypothetical protein
MASTASSSLSQVMVMPSSACSLPPAATCMADISFRLKYGSCHVVAIGG